MSITLPELIAELERASRTNAEGQSVRELAASLKMTESKIKAMLRAGIDAGTIESGRTMRFAIDGTLRPIPVYRVRSKTGGKVRAS